MLGESGVMVAVSDRRASSCAPCRAPGRRRGGPPPAHAPPASSGARRAVRWQCRAPSPPVARPSWSRRSRSVTAVAVPWRLLVPRTRSRFRGAEPSCDRVLDGPAGELGAPAQTGLLADAGEVVLHRARRDVQLLADLVVGQAVGHEPEDLELARRQQRAHGGALAAGAAGELAQQVAGELGRDDRAAAVGRDDRLAQLLARRALREVAGGAGGDRVEQALGALVRRHDQRPDLGQLGAQALEDDRAAQPGHAQVEHHDVRLELAGELHCGDAVVGLADDLDPRVALERPDHTLADEGMVLGAQPAVLPAAPSWGVPGVGVPSMPRRGALATGACPPLFAMRSTMLRRRPMPATACARSTPTPSSLTTTRAPASDDSQRTRTCEARACLCTLLSASRTAPTSAAASAP